jgi:hypothetical protein
MSADLLGPRVEPGSSFLNTSWDYPDENLVENKSDRC